MGGGYSLLTLKEPSSLIVTLTRLDFRSEDHVHVYSLSRTEDLSETISISLNVSVDLTEGCVSSWINRSIR